MYLIILSIYHHSTHIFIIKPTFQATCHENEVTTPVNGFFFGLNDLVNVLPSHKSIQLIFIHQSQVHSKVTLTFQISDKDPIFKLLTGLVSDNKEFEFSILIFLSILDNRFETQSPQLLTC
ncbi:hypothetical protein IKI14_05835 [bacterium]|nr:hypothetical protein [bacterium]